MYTCAHSCAENKPQLKSDEEKKPEDQKPPKFDPQQLLTVGVLWWVWPIVIMVLPGGASIGGGGQISYTTSAVG